MWISVCIRSGYLVKNLLFIHNKSTIDEFDLLKVVGKWGFIPTLLNFFHRLIPNAFGLYKGLKNSFTHYPQGLLLLLLSIKFNIINKTVKKRSFI